MPRCEGSHEDVKRITEYSEIRQWLCATCVADLERPSVQIPPARSTSEESKKPWVANLL